MARIKAFKALRPKQAWINGMLASGDVNFINEKIKEHKLVLEPDSAIAGNALALEKCHINLLDLIASGCYIEEDKPSIYLYQYVNKQLNQFGVWTLTDLQDMEDGRILPHEETLSDHRIQISRYRRQVGLDGAPVLLTYQMDTAIKELIAEVAAQKPKENFCFEELSLRIWAVSETALIAKFMDAFATINHVYVADGHHRLAAAQSLHSVSPQLISTLYVSTADIRIREFNRMVTPEVLMSFEEICLKLEAYFYISPMPGNVAYRPDRAHRMGFCYSGNWYQLDLKQTNIDLQELCDVTILQEVILAPIFGVCNPKTDTTLKSFSADDWTEMLGEHSLNQNSVLFSLFPISIHEFISLSELGKVLPPKSTFIKPKIPFGLMLHSNRLKQYIDGDLQLSDNKLKI